MKCIYVHMSRAAAAAARDSTYAEWEREHDRSDSQICNQEKRTEQRFSSWKFKCIIDCYFAHRRRHAALPRSRMTV